MLHCESSSCPVRMKRICARSILTSKKSSICSFLNASSFSTSVVVEGCHELFDRAKQIRTELKCNIPQSVYADLMHNAILSNQEYLHIFEDLLHQKDSQEPLSKNVLGTVEVALQHIINTKDLKALEKFSQTWNLYNSKILPFMSKSQTDLVLQCLALRLLLNPKVTSPEDLIELIFGRFRRFPSEMSRICFSQVVSALEKSRSVDQLKKLALIVDFQQSCSSENFLVSICESLDRLKCQETILSIFRQFLERPNLIVLTNLSLLLMKRYLSTSQFMELFEVYDLLKSHRADLVSEEHRKLALRAYIYIDKFASVANLSIEMLELNQALDDEIIVLLVGYLAKSESVASLYKVLDSMSTNHLLKDMYYSAPLQYFLQNDRVDDFLALMNHKKSKNVSPTTKFTFNVLLDHFNRTSSQCSVSEIHSVLSQMEDANEKPDVTTLNHLIHFFVSTQNWDELIWVSDVFRQKYALQPDVDTLRIIIEAFTKQHLFCELNYLIQCFMKKIMQSESWSISPTQFDDIRRLLEQPDTSEILLRH